MNSSDIDRSAGSAGGPEASGAEPTEEERHAAATVLRMISGIYISRAVYVAAELGIADNPLGPAHRRGRARPRARDRRVTAAKRRITAPDPRTPRPFPAGERARLFVGDHPA